MVFVFFRVDNDPFVGNRARVERPWVNMPGIHLYVNDTWAHHGTHLQHLGQKTGMWLEGCYGLMTHKAGSNLAGEVDLNRHRSCTAGIANVLWQNQQQLWRIPIFFLEAVVENGVLPCTLAFSQVTPPPQILLKSQGGGLLVCACHRSLGHSPSAALMWQKSRGSLFLSLEPQATHCLLLPCEGKVVSLLQEQALACWITQNNFM